jgi:hypothetical protein
MTTTFFVDVFAWGNARQVQAAFRQVRRQIKEHNEDGGDIQAFRMRQPAVRVNQIPCARRRDVVRAVPLTVDAKTMSTVTDVLWSDAFIKQGGTMAFVAVDIADPTPVFGWVNQEGVVLKQGWDISGQFAKDKHGHLKLEGPQSADQLGDTLFLQFIQQAAVRDHLTPAPLAQAS